MARLRVQADAAAVLAPGTAGTAGTGTGGTAGTGAGGSGTPGMSAGCGKAPTIPSSMYNDGWLITITAANMQRRYILNVPTNYDNTHPYKFVIAYHQRDGNDKQMYANGYYHLLNLANNSTIFVAPNGQKSRALLRDLEQRGEPVRMAQLERFRPGARGCRRQADQRQLLRRHESDLRDGMELRGQHVVPNRVLATARRGERIPARHRRLLRLQLSGSCTPSRTSSVLRLPRRQRFGAALCRWRALGPELCHGQRLQLDGFHEGHQRQSHVHQHSGLHDRVSR